jgi:RNA polymerase sigma-70 factor (ECF subfamily)
MLLLDGERFGLCGDKENIVASCVMSATSTDVPRASIGSSNRDNSSKESEASLIRRAQGGDEQAFATLYETHKRRVYSVCLQMTKNVADAEDLTQDAFFQVFRNVNSFRGDSAFSTWLYRIAVNTVLMKLRRRKAPILVSLDEPVTTESKSVKREPGAPDARLRGTVERLALERATEDLPPGCRQIFDLHEVEGYQHHEIARRLGCSSGNSKSQLHKAKLKLRAVLFPQRELKPKSGTAKAIRSDGAVLRSACSQV